MMFMFLGKWLLPGLSPVHSDSTEYKNYEMFIEVVSPYGAWRFVVSTYIYRVCQDFLYLFFWLFDVI